MRVTGPSCIWRRQVRRRLESMSGVSTIFSKVFLIAKSTLNYLCSSALFPCQKKVQYFSLSILMSAKQVSSKAAMSTCSLRSSVLMTAVFLTSLIFWRSSDNPVVIVRTFQLPSLRTGLFCLMFDLVTYLPGANLTICLSEFSYSPSTHWGRQTVFTGGCWQLSNESQRFFQSSEGTPGAMLYAN